MSNYPPVGIANPPALSRKLEVGTAGQKRDHQRIQ